MKPDALWRDYQTIERETSMTEQKRRFEDQLPSERLDWERGGEPSGDPIRKERQQALLNYAATMLKAEGSASVAIAFPDTDPAQYVTIGTADDILRLLPVPGATDGLLRAKIRDIVALVIERKDIDDLLEDPDLVRLVSAITAMAVRVSGTTPAAAPAAGQAGLAKPVARLQEHISDRPYSEGKKSFDIVILDRARCFDGLELYSAAPVAADTEQATEQSQDVLEEALANVLIEQTNLTTDGIDDCVPRLIAAIPAAALPYKIVPTEGIDPALYATPADAGAGLTDDEIDQIYKEVYAGEQGLALVKRAVRAAEGRIIARMSTPGAPVTESDDLVAAEMKRLHDALCFWLPQNHAGLPDAMVERIAADAYLLVGYDDMPDPKSAEELGWIKTVGQSPAPVTAEPVAWIQFRSDGCYEGPIMHAAIEEVRKKSGAWTPLYATHSAPADRDSIPADDVKWGHDLQLRLLAASQDLAESEDARQVMAEAACLLAALTGRPAATDEQRMERAADAAETRDAKGGE